MSKLIRRFGGNELEDILGISESSSALKPSKSQELKTVLVHQLIPGKFQPRKEFDNASLKELADSIKQNGIIQPIIVRASESNYEIIAGERRWRAAQMAGVFQVPIIVCEISDQSALAFGIIENIQRKDLNPIEEALALQRLIAEFSMTHAQVAKAIGRSRTMVTNMLRLLNLSESLKLLLASKKIEMGHARAMLGLSENQQKELAALIIQKSLSVRETEKLVKGFSDVNKQSNIEMEQEFNKFCLQWQEDFSRNLSATTRVHVANEGKGRIVIHFESLAGAQWIMDHLKVV